MLEQYHPVEFELINRGAKKAGLSSLHAAVRAEARRYIQQSTLHLLDYSLVVMQHCYRTKHNVEDFRHALLQLWIASSGLPSEINFMTYPSDTDSEDEAFLPEEESDEEEEEEEEELDSEEECEVDSNEEEEEEEQSPSKAKEEVMVSDHSDDLLAQELIDRSIAIDPQDYDPDLVDSPLSVDSAFLPSVSRYLQEKALTISWARTTFDQDIAKEYADFVISQLSLSLKSLPNIWSRMAGRDLGLLNAFYLAQSKPPLSPVEEQLAQSNSERASTVTMITAIKDLVDVLKTMQERQNLLLLTPPDLSLQSSALEPPPTVPSHTAPASSSSSSAFHLSAIAKLTRQLKRASTKITSLEEALAVERRHSSNLEAKDRKMRELVVTLKNVSELDDAGISMLRELSHSRSSVSDPVVATTRLDRHRGDTDRGQATLWSSAAENNVQQNNSNSSSYLLDRLVAGNDSEDESLFEQENYSPSLGKRKKSLLGLTSAASEGRGEKPKRQRWEGMQQTVQQQQEEEEQVADSRTAGDSQPHDHHRAGQSDHTPLRNR